MSGEVFISDSVEPVDEWYEEILSLSGKGRLRADVCSTVEGHEIKLRLILQWDTNGELWPPESCMDTYENMSTTCAILFHNES